MLRDSDKEITIARAANFVLQDKSFARRHLFLLPSHCLLSIVERARIGQISFSSFLSNHLINSLEMR